MSVEEGFTFTLDEPVVRDPFVIDEYIDLFWVCTHYVLMTLTVFAFVVMAEIGRRCMTLQKYENPRVPRTESVSPSSYGRRRRGY